jgi:hypothetical protein
MMMLLVFMAIDRQGEIRMGAMERQHENWYNIIIDNTGFNSSPWQGKIVMIEQTTRKSTICTTFDIPMQERIAI